MHRRLPWLLSSVAALSLMGSGVLAASTCAVTLGQTVAYSCLGVTAQDALEPLPSLQDRGGPLILSDNPEAFTQDGAFYRDTVTGRFRVFLHHQNRTGSGQEVGVALTNPGPSPEVILSLGAGTGTSVYPDVAGQSALAGFLATRYRTRPLALLMPGQSVTEAVYTPPGETTSGFEDFSAVGVPSGVGPGPGRGPGLPPVPSLPSGLLRAAHPSPFLPNARLVNHPPLPPGFTAAPVTVTTLAFSGPPPRDPASIAVEPPSIPLVIHGRGTFPADDRFGVIDLSTTRPIQWLAVDSAISGPYSRAMPGEYLTGYDAVDHTSVVDNGNYGVLYNFHVVVDNAAHVRAPYWVLLQPSGGFGHYVESFDGGVEVSPFLNYLHAWAFAETTLHPNRNRATLDTSLTGGSDGPQKLIFDGALPGPVGPSLPGPRGRVPAGPLAGGSGAP